MASAEKNNQRINKKIILDTSAILRGFDFSGGQYATTGDVVREISGEFIRAGVESALGSNNLKIYEPKEQFIERVKTAAKLTGDLDALSNTDTGIIAVAAEFDLCILSDDYAIQNVAASLGIKQQGIVQEGIAREISWKWICEGCGAKYETGGVCGICGLRIKRYKRDK